MIKTIKLKIAGVAKPLFLAMLCVSNVVFAQNEIKHTVVMKSSKDFKEFFRYTPNRMPIVCGHRGGAQYNSYPENSIEGMEYVLSKIPAFFEIDPRLTKDSVVVLMHDATLDRTTTGTGKLADYTYEEVKKLQLKDVEGNVTNYKIPTLADALDWSMGKTLLMLDKKDVPHQMIYDLIVKHKAQNRVIISSYVVEDALFYHRKDKNIMFEAFMTQEGQLEKYENAKIPLENMFAYIGQPKKASYYKELHNKGLMTMIFSAKIIEKNPKNKRLELYQDAIERGSNILLTNRAIEVYNLIQQTKNN